MGIKAVDKMRIDRMGSYQFENCISYCEWGLVVGFSISIFGLYDLIWQLEMIYLLHLVEYIWENPQYLWLLINLSCFDNRT